MSRLGTATLGVLLALASGSALAQEEPAPSYGFAPTTPSPPPPAAAPQSPDQPEETLPTKVADVPGTWDLSRDGTNRRCVMTLLRDRGPAGQKVNFPPGCRRALPFMGNVAGWLYAEETVRLVDANVRPLLLFKRRPDRRSYAATENGETYSLVPLDIVGMRPPGAEPPPPEAAPAPAPAPVPVPEPLRQPAGAAPRAQTAAGTPDDGAAPRPGTYLLDRFRQQGTCRLDLGAGGAVKLLPGCQDEGMEVFNPVRWHYAGGRLTLTAKRGHTIGLVPNGDGGWRRDPEVGTTLVLRRAEP
ncbi:AprI/Inh family metalloprotease inhibitor [Methylobacterium sp. J-076]|uniref:AprI/Inh family metalloprotease inhibitor n=1 Tax=Methylobacterium sp. J-076 TaxID=2836655 RepID=UPI0028C38135|nr:AprI/Inh family metalloprotease inhibitor [Methylobacterium sp. J-076]